jgi:Family of unknown function (DUF6416)
MPDITVPVPDERTAEFYQFFGRWLAGSVQQEPEIPGEGSPGVTDTLKGQHDKPRHWTGSDDDLEDAEYLWGKYNKRAKGLFNLLMEDPGRPYTGRQIAEAVGIPNGANGVAGVLAWPGRYGLERQRHLPSLWKDGEDGAESVYWMEPEVADLFSKVRAKLDD